MSKQDNPNIKEVHYDDKLEVGGAPIKGHPLFPQEKNPGYGVDHPTCSKPAVDNKGCDAWNECTTKGQGPYTVAFFNKSGTKSATHCRNWMYKLQFKAGYRATDDPWEPCHVQEPTDESGDVKKGMRGIRYKMKIEDVRLPVSEGGKSGPMIQPEVTGVETEEDVEYPVEGIKNGDRGTDNQEEGAEGSVGDKGNRRRRSSS